MKVSVVCTTFRPGYIDVMAQSLGNQTMNQDEWELILVDDFCKQRGQAVKVYMQDKIKNFKHIPPRELREYSANCVAFNAGITHCCGELIYFSNDYLYPEQRCLQRHWEIYQKYGPKVLIHGPLIDRIVASGHSVWQGAPPELYELVKEGKPFYHWNLTPPIDMPLKPNFDKLTAETAISIFAAPFQPIPFLSILPDWRTGATATGEPIDANLYENHSIHPWSWWWAGRNTSAPLELLLEVNGFDESFDGLHGGADGDIGYRMMHISGGEMWREDAIEAPRNDCRYLVDTQLPAYELIHRTRKMGIISEAERQSKVASEQAKKPIPNDYSLRQERERILKKK